MLPAVPPRVVSRQEAEMMAYIATASLSDQVFGPTNERIRYPLQIICNQVANAFLQAVFNDHEGFLTSLDPTGPLVKVRLSHLLGIGDWCISERNLQGYLQDEFSYSNGGTVYRVEDFERHRTIIEGIWGCPVTIERMSDNPMGVTIRPAPPALPPPPPLQLPKEIWLRIIPNRIVLGTDIKTGELVATEVRKMTHMLIVGTSGFGKSVFLNAVITQLLAADPEEVAELALVDLKGGVEFHGYARKSDRAHVVWEIEEVVETVQRLVELMRDRQREMVANNWRTYPGRRVFFIVDEFAQIQLWKPITKDEKEAKDELLGNLNRLSMLGRAVGVMLIAAIQKPSTDVMDSSFRMNLQGQACFKVPRLLASTIFGSLDELELDPSKLTQGRFIYYDSITATTHYLQGHMVPD